MRIPLLLSCLLLTSCTDLSGPVMYPAASSAASSESLNYFRDFVLEAQIKADLAGLPQAFEKEYARYKPTNFLWNQVLAAALTAGSKDAARYLLQQRSRVPGADLKQYRADLLAAAAAAKDSQMLEWLLKDPEWKDVGFDLNQADPTTGVDNPNYNSETPLMLAVRKANLANLDWMIQQGADPLRIDQNGDNVLNHAITADRKDVFEFFVAKGLSLNPDKARPPLMTAASQQRREWMSYLLDKGASVHATFEESYFDYAEGQKVRTTALGQVVANYSSDLSLELMQMLIDKGASLDRPEHAHVLSLFLANSALYEEREMLKLDLLLKAKADVNVKDGQGRTPIMLYLANGWNKPINLLQRLIESGADLRAADNQGKTVLMYAVEGGTLAMVQQLMFRGLGADLAKTDKQGRTARMLAHGDIERYLSSIPTLPSTPLGER